MDFFLIDPSGEKFRLPVNPGELSIRREKKFDTINILYLGEVDFPNGEKIQEISFSSFFPKEYDLSYCKYADLPDPTEAMGQLTRWMNSRKPVRLVITDTPINQLVLISAHSSAFRGGEPGDIYFELTCRTWREVKVRTTAEASGSSESNNRPDVKPVPKVYVVRKGDSLWKIAKLNLGKGSRWREIYRLNTTTIGLDPNLIHPGMKLVMPS